jgi:iron-sulfur cluster repair protein YtfE (RIC family)
MLPEVGMSVLPTEAQPADTAAAYLGADHARLDHLLVDVEQMVDDGELERAEHTYAELHVAIDRHLRLEEELLFPAFERATGVGQGPIATMRSEHHVIRAALEDIRQALERHDASRFRAGHARLVDVMVPHHFKEERVLYPATDRLLPFDERVTLLARMRAFR